MDTHACPLIHVHLLSHTARIWACGTDILQNQGPKFIHQQGKCTHTLLLELFDDNRHKLMLFTSHCRQGPALGHLHAGACVTHNNFKSKPAGISILQMETWGSGSLSGCLRSPYQEVGVRTVWIMNLPSAIMATPEPPVPSGIFQPCLILDIT